MTRNSTAVWFAVAAAGALLLYARRQAAAGALLLHPASANINNLIASPAEEAAYVALTAGGPPSLLGSRGAGQVEPTTFTPFGAVWRGDRLAWRAPVAGASTAPALVAAPGGRFLAPGPYPPGAPTPQSAVQGSSPWLPYDLRLAGPLAASPWLFHLSAAEPAIAFGPGAGGYVWINPERIGLPGQES